MRLKYRAEFYDGETKEILVSPMAMIGWEKHTGKTMGLEDRDYMHRPDDDAPYDAASYESEPYESPSDKVADAVRGFFHRNPRFFLYVGIVLAVLIIGAIVTATLGL